MAWGSGGSLKGYVQAENRMTGPGAPTEAAPADAAWPEDLGGPH